MEIKTNYILTTWSGKRRIPNNNYLKRHLLKLLSLKHNLSQITIIKPIMSSCNDFYYDGIEKIISKINCKVEILERYSNVGISYGQFFYAYEKYRNDFDYYIFIEDDYMPDIDYFDKLLIDEYKSQNVKGYLCSFGGISKRHPNGGCSISNGMISSKYMQKIYDKLNPLELFKNKRKYDSQTQFTNMLIESKLEIKDIVKQYRVPYYGNHIKEYGRTDTKKSIFIPFQLYDINFEFKKMSIDDLPYFLKVRNISKDFLHNNSEYKLDDAIKWFKDTNPLFYMIKINGINIGYFRTSNLKNNSMYIGCDLHPNFRGFGLATLAYNQFIKKISKEYNLKEIKLEVLSNNSRAINLYEKLGFIRTGISDKKIKRNKLMIDSIIMKKIL